MVCLLFGIFNWYYYLLGLFFFLLLFDLFLLLFFRLILVGIRLFNIIFNSLIFIILITLLLFLFILVQLFFLFLLPIVLRRKLNIINFIMILFPSLVLIVFDPSPKIFLFITVLHQLVQLFSLFLLDLISIFLILLYDLIGNHSFIFFQGKDHFLKVVVSMVQSLLYVAISSSELQAMDELWKLLI